MPLYQDNLSIVRKKMAIVLGWALIRVRALISRRGLEGGSNTGTGPNSGTGSNSDNYGNLKSLHHVKYFFFFFNCKVL